jgi:tRNA nucleotidyltransferase (CCA-adding enzyme)
MSTTHPIHGAAAALERLAGLPGGTELLAQSRRRDDIALVGGAVRDLLLGHWPRELDVTVAGSAAELAEALAASISPSERAYGRAVVPVLHERFGTASVRWAYGRIDIAERRAESYAVPGALPVVRPGSVEQDLARRDFTVNAITLPLGGPRRGELLAVEDALEDLGAGRLRILHEESFTEDPTRLLRLGRYAARLGFEVEPRTLELALGALGAGALATVSGVRIGSELLLVTEEADPGAFTRLGRLGVLAALGLPASFDEELYRAAAAMMPPDGSRGALELAVLFHAEGGEGPPSPARAEALMERFELPAEKRAVVLAGAYGLDRLAARIEPEMAPSRLRELLGSRPPEALAILGALAARRSLPAGETVGRWLGELRHVRLEIGGDDLLAAGVVPGPELGRRLELALAARLDGRLEPGREAELRAALEAPL